MWNSSSGSSQQYNNICYYARLLYIYTVYANVCRYISNIIIIMIDVYSCFRIFFTLITAINTKQWKIRYLAMFVNHC